MSARELSERLLAWAVDVLTRRQRKARTRKLLRELLEARERADRSKLDTPRSRPPRSVPPEE